MIREKTENEKADDGTEAVILTPVLLLR